MILNTVAFVGDDCYWLGMYTLPSIQHLKGIPSQFSRRSATYIVCEVLQMKQHGVLAPGKILFRLKDYCPNASTFLPRALS